MDASVLGARRTPPVDSSTSSPDSPGCAESPIGGLTRTNGCGRESARWLDWLCLAFAPKAFSLVPVVFNFVTILAATQDLPATDSDGHTPSSSGVDLSMLAAAARRVMGIEGKFKPMNSGRWEREKNELHYVNSPSCLFFEGVSFMSYSTISDVPHVTPRLYLCLTRLISDLIFSLCVLPARFFPSTGLLRTLPLS